MNPHKSVNTIPTKNQQLNEYLERNEEILQSVPIFLAHTLGVYSCLRHSRSSSRSATWKILIYSLNNLISMTDVKLCLMTSNYNALTSNNCCAMASVFDVIMKVGYVTCKIEFFGIFGLTPEFPTPSVRVAINEWQ